MGVWGFVEAAAEELAEREVAVWSGGPAEVVRIEGAAEILDEGPAPVPPKASASSRMREVIEVFDRALERMGGPRTRRHCWFATNV